MVKSRCRKWADSRICLYSPEALNLLVFVPAIVGGAWQGTGDTNIVSGRNRAGPDLRTIRPTCYARVRGVHLWLGFGFHQSFMHRGRCPDPKTLNSTNSRPVSVGGGDSKPPRRRAGEDLQACCRRCTSPSSPTGSGLNDESTVSPFCTDAYSRTLSLVSFVPVAQALPGAVRGRPAAV